MCTERWVKRELSTPVNIPLNEDFPQSAKGAEYESQGQVPIHRDDAPGGTAFKVEA